MMGPKRAPSAHRWHPWCWALRRNLTALVDGELGAARAARLERHLAACGSCGALRAQLEGSVSRQTHLLRAITTPGTVESEALLRGLRQRVVEDPEPRRWLLQPVTLAACGLAALVIAVVVTGPAGYRDGTPNEGDAIAADTSRQARGQAVQNTPIVAQLQGKVAPPKLRARAGAEPLVPAPPEAVESQPELFVEYDLFRRLEALEHFETVRSLHPIDPAVPDQHG